MAFKNPRAALHFSSTILFCMQQEMHVAYLKKLLLCTQLKQSHESIVYNLFLEQYVYILLWKPLSSFLNDGEMNSQSSSSGAVTLFLLSSLPLDNGKVCQRGETDNLELLLFNFLP